MTKSPNLIFDKYTKLCQTHNMYDAIHILYALIDKGYSVIDILSLRIKINLLLFQVYFLIFLLMQYKLDF